MIHGLLRISCSRNPKTPQIHSFFYEKWLLSVFFASPPPSGKSRKTPITPPSCSNKRLHGSFAALPVCCAPPPQAAQKFVIATTDEHTCADCPTQGEQSAQVCPDVGVRTNSALPVEEGAVGTPQRAKKGAAGAVPSSFYRFVITLSIKPYSMASCADI